MMTLKIATVLAAALVALAPAAAAEDNAGTVLAKKQGNRCATARLRKAYGPLKALRTKTGLQFTIVERSI